MSAGSAAEGAGTGGAGQPFRLECPFEPSGDQPQAIRALVEGGRAGARDQCLP